jgi:hopanoid biosynthesis associated radical SAM protein HpnH
MRFPLHITTDNIKHQWRNARAGQERYPFVLMLEPLYACNLACIGCTPERHTGKLKDRLTLEQCLQAVDDADAPIVSICGGEPLMYPELPELIQGIIDRGKHIYLCTNALLIDKKLFGAIPPNKRLTVNIHLDGLEDTHDYVCDREGVYKKAVEMAKECLDRGYHVFTNTTVFKETDIDEVEQLCSQMSEIGVHGMLVSPGYQYETIDRDIFLTRKDIESKFRRVLDFADQYRLTSTPMFLEFAAGMRDYQCSPWSTVTYTPLGWKGPCYLITDAYYETYEEFWNGVDWEYWESREDRRCQNCAMHSGFEASVVKDLSKSPRDMLRLAYWNFAG